MTLQELMQFRVAFPCLCKVAPSCDYHIQDVHRAGIHTILGELKRIDESNGYVNGVYKGSDKPKQERILNLSCKTVTGKTIGDNINEYDIRSQTASDEAKITRVSGCSMIFGDKNSQVSKSPRGTIAPKPLFFFAGDVNTILLWRLASVWNTNAVDALSGVFASNSNLTLSDKTKISGNAAISEFISESINTAQGLVKAELASLNNNRCYFSGNMKKVAAKLLTNY
jgi:dihydroxy-acid dehydratase